MGKKVFISLLSTGNCSLIECGYLQLSVLGIRLNTNTLISYCALIFPQLSVLNTATLQNAALQGYVNERNLDLTSSERM